MKLPDDDLRVWAIVAATVHPLPGRALPRPPARSTAKVAPARAMPIREPLKAQATPASDPASIEPRRYRRIVLGREPFGARIDLHGLDQGGAQQALTALIQDAFDRGVRGVLVI
ncbi:MAG TPA: DNA mismatch repair protein MutS, partial [Caulobacteraceae bacterium]